jgi:hypothetical protein
METGNKMIIKQKSLPEQYKYIHELWDKYTKLCEEIEHIQSLYGTSGLDYAANFSDISEELIKEYGETKIEEDSK